MKFAPEGHDYNGFTQYFFEGKELEFLEILLSGKDKQHCCCKSEHVNCEFCPDSKCLTKVGKEAQTIKQEKTGKTVTIVHVVLT
jgi:hypothetical protein